MEKANITEQSVGNMIADLRDEIINQAIAKLNEGADDINALQDERTHIEDTVRELLEGEGVDTGTDEGDKLFEEIADSISAPSRRFVRSDSPPIEGSARALSMMVSCDFAEDHRLNMEQEGTWAEHRADEPDCSYCKMVAMSEHLLAQLNGGK